MSLSEIREDIESRQPLFTPFFGFDAGEELNPDARVWCGMSGPGPFDRSLPILFHQDPGGPRNAVDYFKSFTNESVDDNRVKPFAYGSDRAVNSYRVDVLYDIKPIKPGSVDIEHPSPDGIQRLASHWADERSESSVETELRPMNDSIFRYYLDLRIYGQRFQTHIPIFTSVPSATEVKDELKKLRIPCVTLVENEGNYDKVTRPFETTVTPGIISLQ